MAAKICLLLLGALCLAGAQPLFPYGGYGSTVIDTLPGVTVCETHPTIGAVYESPFYSGLGGVTTLCETSPNLGLGYGWGGLGGLGYGLGPSVCETVPNLRLGYGYPGYGLGSVCETVPNLGLGGLGGLGYGGLGGMRSGLLGAY